MDEASIPKSSVNAQSVRSEQQSNQSKLISSNSKVPCDKPNQYSTPTVSTLPHDSPVVISNKKVPSASTARINRDLFAESPKRDSTPITMDPIKPRSNSSSNIKTTSVRKTSEDFDDSDDDALQESTPLPPSISNTKMKTNSNMMTSPNPSLVESRITEDDEDTPMNRAFSRQKTNWEQSQLLGTVPLQTSHTYPAMV
jgi:hypothetical protein